MTNYSVHPDTVAAFGFDWGQLALIVGPEVNGANRFSGGMVTAPPPAVAIPATTILAQNKSFL